jgi:predicted metal-binding transcription factor (methanogenesis marker protein 9)
MPCRPQLGNQPGWVCHIGYYNGGTFCCEPFAICGTNHTGTAGDYRDPSL